MDDKGNGIADDSSSTNRNGDGDDRSGNRKRKYTSHIDSIDDDVLDTNEIHGGTNGNHLCSLLRSLMLLFNTFTELRTRVATVEHGLTELRTRAATVEHGLALAQARITELEARLGAANAEEEEPEEVPEEDEDEGEEGGGEVID